MWWHYVPFYPNGSTHKPVKAKFKKETYQG